MNAQTIEFANFLFTFGSFVFTGVGVVVALLTIFAGYLTFKADKLHRSWETDLRSIREQQEKINNTLIVTSDLAIAALPQITFTQQIPIAVLDDVGIIDDIFDGPAGDNLWRAVVSQPRAARLAYARAVYKLGMHSDSRLSLVGTKGTSDNATTVVGLLDSALIAAERSLRDPISLKRDILVRKCQAYRQAGDLQRAYEAAQELIGLHRAYDDSAAYFLGSLSLTLVGLQRAGDTTSLPNRAKEYAEAVTQILGAFNVAFGHSPPSDASTDGGARLRYYRNRSHGIELASIAYYTAKALWSHLFATAAIPQSANRPATIQDGSARLRRAIDLALLFFESLRREQHPDPYISAIYHFCVANLIVAAREIPEAFLGFEEFRVDFPELDSSTKMSQHATLCLDIAADLLNDIRHSAGNGNAKFIYSERSEKLDSIAAFGSDIRWLRSVLAGNRTYREHFVTELERHK